MVFVGKNLKYLRTLFDLTVSGFAESILQTGESNYRKMEGNQSGITFDKAKLISDFFEISLNELFDTENYSLAKVISRKDDNYMNRILEKMKKLRYSPPPERVMSSGYLVMSRKYSAAVSSWQ